MPYRRKKLTFAISSPDEFLLANVNSRSRSLYMLLPFRLSVVCLSVTLVRPTQPVEIFGNFSSFLLLFLLLFLLFLSSSSTAPETISHYRDMVGADHNLNGSRDLTTPISGMVCHIYGLALLPSAYLGL